MKLGNVKSANAIGIWGIILLLILYTAYSYSGPKAWRLGPPLGQREGLDFEAFTAAARAIQTQENPYAQALRFSRNLDFQEYFDNGTGYAYPPIFAAALVPFVGFTDDVLSTIWVNFSFLLLFVCAALLVLVVNQHRNPKTSQLLSQFVLVSILMFAHYPTQLDLKLGQNNIFILFLIVASFGLFRQRSSMSGFTLAVAIAIKPFLAVLLLFLVWKKDWRAVTWALFVSIVLFGLGFSLIGWTHLPSWMTVNALFSSGGYLAVPDNQSISGLATRLFAANFVVAPLAVLPTAVRLIPIVISVIAAGVWLSVVRFGVRRDAATEAGEYALTLLLAMLISPFTGIWHLTWVLLPLAWLLCVSLMETPQPRQLFWFGSALLCALYLGAPLLSQLVWSVGVSALRLGGAVPASLWAHTATSMYLYGLIALYGLLALWLYTRKMTTSR